ncbi:MAG: NAD(P)H-dependent oxidoreductase [Actinomycetota bacterium]|nr:NAD(P)H-dependent oxidoreductase [Actinomycetota bacterium]
MSPTRAEADATEDAARVLRVDASIRDAGSVGRSLADEAVDALGRDRDGVVVTRRDLGREPLPPVWPAAEAARTTPVGERTGPQRHAAELAAGLVDELLDADVLVVAAPMYNFGPPQQVKHWIDLVITDHRAMDVNVPILPGRPALLVATRGGAYGTGTPRAGWDHATPFLRRILADVWGLDLTVVEVELTAADEVPAMAGLREAARRQLADAHDLVREWAATIATRRTVGG